MSKQWLEIHITINGFTYAVRKEVESISEIWEAGGGLSHRLQNIIDNRETKNLIENPAFVSSTKGWIPEVKWQ